LLGLASRRGYAISRSRSEHAGGKIFLGYRSAIGTPDRIEVDLNYLFRTPLSPLQRVLYGSPVTWIGRMSVPLA